ncbi:MAG: hypothetical protein P8Z36_13720, partial [Gemmatimonadota bacterium]
LEDVVRRDPDVIIVAQAPEQPGLLAHLRRKAGWSSLRAVGRGRVYQVDAYRYNRPGPHMVEIARDLADLLHRGTARPPAAPSPAGLDAATGPVAPSAMGTRP